MRFSLLAALEAVRPALSDTLVSPDGFADLLRTAARMPPIATTFGFECRLGHAERVDLGISVEAANGGRAQLAEPGAALDGAGADPPTWARLRRFARAWNEPASLAHQWVPYALLELGADALAPSIFTAVDWPLDPDDLPALRAAAKEILALLLERDCAREVERCFALPRFARVLHVGARPTQPRPALHVAASLPHDGVAAYLAGLGHGNELAALEEVLARAERGVASPHPWRPRLVDFDAGDAGCPIAIGLRPSHPDQWPGILAALVEAGVGDEDACAALLAWPGTDQHDLGAPCRIRRYLGHVKLSLREGAIEARVHAGAAPHYLPVS